MNIDEFIKNYPGDPEALRDALAEGVTESDREAARWAMVRGYHDCGARWQAGPSRNCDCDDSRIDGCKKRVEAIAAVIAAAR